LLQISFLIPSACQDFCCFAGKGRVNSKSKVEQPNPDMIQGS
jgi:hypothetical protein